MAMRISQCAAVKGGQVMRAMKRDCVEPQVIEALEKAGWHVWQHLPVDLLCWKVGHGFHLLEVKTGKRKLRPGGQTNFVQTTGCPVVRTPMEALKALGAGPLLPDVAE